MDSMLAGERVGLAGPACTSSTATRTELVNCFHLLLNVEPEKGLRIKIFVCGAAHTSTDLVK